MKLRVLFSSVSLAVFALAFPGCESVLLAPRPRLTENEKYISAATWARMQGTFEGDVTVKAHGETYYGHHVMKVSGTPRRPRVEYSWGTQIAPALHAYAVGPNKLLVRFRHSAMELEYVGGAYELTWHRQEHSTGAGRLVRK